MSLVALTRLVSATLADCELTHLARAPLDVPRAAEQHAAYERLLGELGAAIERVAEGPEYPDAVFIEDTAVVLDEVAVITRPGALSRRGETAAVEAALEARRPVVTMQGDGTLDGGDVLRLGRVLYAGLSSRTNRSGVDELARLVNPFDYRVVPVEFSGCLHLKSAVTDVADGLLLLNPAWVSVAAFADWEALAVDVREPHGGNALRVGGSVVYPSQYPRTLELLRERGLNVSTLDYDELAKAEGGVTCCCLLIG